MNQPQNIVHELHGALRKHGHAFQYAVMRRTDLLYSAHRTRWALNSSEVPVQTQGLGTRVDFVLQWRDQWHHAEDRFLVAECKRANPALANWCFLKAPYTDQNPHPGQVIVDQIQRHESAFTAEARYLAFGRDVYQLAYELRSDKKGEGAPGRGAIDEACAQLLRGVNGLINLFAAHPEPLQLNKPTILLPVLFTTAKLWRSSTDIAAADLSTGTVDIGSVEAVPAPWVWLNYNMTPGLKHDVPRTSRMLDLGKLVEMWFGRTIAVVSADGIDEFMTNSHFW